MQTLENFSQVDIDHSGALDMEEMRLALAGFGLHFTDDMVREMFAFCDTDGSGEVDYNEFEQVCVLYRWIDRCMNGFRV